MIPYSRHKVYDFYTLSQTKLQKTNYPSQWHIPIYPIYGSNLSPLSVASWFIIIHYKPVGDALYNNMLLMSFLLVTN